MKQQGTCAIFKKVQFSKKKPNVHLSATFSLAKSKIKLHDLALANMATGILWLAS